MKINKTLFALALGAALLVGGISGGYAAVTYQTVTANIRYDYHITYDGVEKVLKDTNGNRVFPINYNGSTYLPVRAISGLLGVNVDWDGNTNTVILGDAGRSARVDLIDGKIPHILGDAFSSVIPSSKGEKCQVAGRTLDHWIRIGTGLSYGLWRNTQQSYNPDGKYQFLTFTAYAPDDVTLVFYNNQTKDSVLGTVNLEAGVPSTHTIELNGAIWFVLQAQFDSDNHIYIYDAYLE